MARAGRAVRRFVEGGGACGALIATYDWASTSLGPMSAWPPSLLATVANLLHARQPMLLFWGPDLIQLYNDSFVPSFGQGKHPVAMGQPARECWRDAWPVIGAQIDAVMTRGEPAWFADALVPIFRNDRMEEVFWTYSYSPAFDDDGTICGTLVIVTETTARVLATRRLEALSALGVALAASASSGAVFGTLAEVVARWPADVPFMVIRTAGGDRGAEAGVAGARADAIARAALASSPSRDPRELVLEGGVASSVWPEPVTRALAVTLDTAEEHVLVFGTSPRLPIDGPYLSFVAQIAEQVTSALRRIDNANASLAAQQQRDELLDERGRVMIALEDANRAKDEFLAMLGHELRNPLAPIVTALELMGQKSAEGRAERAVIERQLRHVIRLVDDLLDISKITRGLITLEKRTVDLADVVGAAVEASRHLIEQRGHRLAVDAPHGVLVDGDEARLTQIVSNLLTNAARYTPPGGDIRVALTTEGDAAILRTTDTGAGIDADLLPQVFDLFVQGTRSAERAEGGLGLGLAIVKNLVALHGGTVSAHSDGPGTGSTFTIRLPRRAPPRVAQTPESRRHQPTVAASKRVLVVDDNEDAANLLAEIARMRGHDVTVAHDPARALEIADTLQPEIAVLDIGLPGMDGYELAAHLRARWPDCRLVALTGYGQDRDRARSEQAGFVAHLVKPVRVEQLLEMLAQM